MGAGVERVSQSRELLHRQVALAVLERKRVVRATELDELLGLLGKLHFTLVFLFFQDRQHLLGRRFGVARVRVVYDSMIASTILLPSLGYAESKLMVMMSSFLPTSTSTLFLR